MKKITFLIGILFIICCIGCEGDSGSDSYRWVDLGFFNGIKDINNSGQIIGTHEVQIEGQSYTRSLLYNPSGTIIDLGTFGGHAYASDINNEGEVVGTSYFLDGGWHAFLYRDEEHGMIDLGTLGGNNSSANAINDRGQIVGGSAYDLYGFSHAFLYNGGSMQDIGSPDRGDSYAYDINELGHIVGYDHVPDEHAIHAFLYRGSLQDLGTLLDGTDSHAEEINNDYITGYYMTTDGDRHSFLYYSDSDSDISEMYEIGTFGGKNSYAMAVNGKGQVVGRAQVDGLTHRAFLFEHNVLHELGGVNNDTSSANDINSSGQIVGSATNDAGDDFAFLYNDGIMYDLNDLCTENNDDRSIGSAYLINNSGRIICWDNTLHGYILLIPIS